MSFVVKIQEQPEYLSVEMYGTRIADTITQDILGAYSLVFEKCKETGHNRVLNQLYQEGKLPIAASYNILNMPKISHWKEIKMAVVAVDYEIYLQIKFAETVAQSRGFQYRLFQNKEEGLNWLLS
jgi:hypothetical protein